MLFGARAGLIAAFCLAVSSVHVFQAQEIREYGMTTAVAALSCYTFLRLEAAGTWRWRAANAAANLLLVWTYLFGCWLLVAHGLYLICTGRRRWRNALLWFAVNIPLMLPTLYWIRGMKGYVVPNAQVMPPRQILGNAFQDCLNVVYFPVPLSISEYPWINLPPAWSGIFVRTAGQFESISLWLFLAAAGLLAVGALSRRGEGAPTFSRAALFTLIWLFVPVLVLYTVSMVWRPDAFSQKYTTYCSLALYLTLGAVTTRVLRGWPARILCVMLIAVFGHRAVLYHTQVQRTDWAAAAAHIQTHRAPGDIVLGHPLTTPTMITFVLGEGVIPLKIYEHVEELAAAAEETLASGAGVWVVWIEPPNPVRNRFDRYAIARGWHLKRWGYDAAQLPGVLVAEVRAGNEPGESPEEALRAATIDFDAARALVESAWERQARGDHMAALNAFERALESNPYDIDALDGFVLCAQQIPSRLAQAGQLCDRFLSRFPENSRVHVLKGATQAAAGATAGCEESFLRAMRIAPYETGWVSYNYADIHERAWWRYFGEAAL
jgi:hypothetical protein